MCQVSQGFQPTPAYYVIREKVKAARNNQFKRGIFNMVAISTPAETRTLLENISWQTFKAMLADMGSSRNTRLAYENGTLEIFTPFMLHENSNRVISFRFSSFPAGG